MSEIDPRVVALPHAWGGPAGTGTLRERREHFEVTEVLGFAPAGEGEHLLVHLRKSGWTTDAAARQLARAAGVRPADVGFCGMKDRHAVTTQWFSLPLGARPEPAWDGLGDGLSVVETARHRRKLRRGAHRANRFRLTISHFLGDAELAEERVRQLALHGFPNYFGAQRFGRDGANAARARAMLRGELPVARHERGLLLSALRSELFNAVLAARVAEGSWRRALPGDVLMLAGSHSIFPFATADEGIAERLAAHDVHVSGPLCGADSGGPEALTDRERRELAAFAPDIEALAGARVQSQRRALRGIARDLTFNRAAPDRFQLGFELEPGVYATSVVRELVDTG